MLYYGLFVVDFVSALAPVDLAPLPGERLSIKRSVLLL